MFKNNKSEEKSNCNKKFLYKRCGLLDLFSFICIIIVATMFTVSTFFIISQCISAIKMYNNINSCCLTKLLDLKEYFNSSITEEIYSLIYAFMSTAIVGLGGYILKNNNNTKDEIKKDLETAGDKQYTKLKRKLEEDSRLNILISDVSIAHQYICAMEVEENKDLFQHSFGDTVKHINETVTDIQQITDIQRNFINDILSYIIVKYENLINDGLPDPPNDSNKTIIQYLKESKERIESI